MKFNASLSTVIKISLRVPKIKHCNPFSSIYINYYFSSTSCKILRILITQMMRLSLQYGSDVGSILESLEGMPNCYLIGSETYKDKYIKMNEGKSHLLVFGNKDDKVTVNTSGVLIKENNKDKLLGITLNRKSTLILALMNFVKKQVGNHMLWQECQDISKSKS